MMAAIKMGMLALPLTVPMATVAFGANIECPGRFQESNGAIVSGTIERGAPLTKIGLLEDRTPRKFAPAWLIADKSDSTEEWTILPTPAKPMVLLCAYGSEAGLVAHRLNQGTMRCRASFKGGLPSNITCSLS